MRAYQYPVRADDDVNPAAHGNITITERCLHCPAERQRNVNGRHEEASDWYAPSDGED